MSYYLECPVVKNYHVRATWINNAMFGLPMHCERLCFLDYALTKFIGISHKRMMGVHIVLEGKRRGFLCRDRGSFVSAGQNGGNALLRPPNKAGLSFQRGEVFFCLADF